MSYANEFHTYLYIACECKIVEVYVYAGTRRFFMYFNQYEHVYASMNVQLDIFKFCFVSLLRQQ